MYLSHIKHENTCIKNPKNLKECKQCGGNFSAVRYNRNSQFCGQSCSTTFNNHFRTKITYSISCISCTTEIIIKNKNSSKMCAKCNNKNYISKIDKKLENTCVICQCTFLTRFNKKKTCSNVCYRKLISNNSTSNSNCGGETNFKRYFRNGIMFDSSWEIKIAEFLDSLNIKWIRDRKIMLYWIDKNENKRRYYPDFYLPEHNVYIDPKNTYRQLLDTDKISYIKKHHNLIVGDVEHCKSEILTILKKVVELIGI